MFHLTARTDDCTSIGLAVGSNTGIDTSQNKMTILYLAIDRIKPNPYQPRRMFDKSALEDLANSIREFGVMQPINVRLINNSSYELVSGERRLRASKMAGLSTIPAVVIDVNDRDSGLIALIENLQRENLSFLDEAEGFQNLMADYGLTQDDLARRLGKSQSSVANKLRLLRLSPTVKRLVIDNHLTERHARALLRLPDEKLQIHIIGRIIELDLNVKKTEDLIEQTIDKIMNTTKTAQKKGQKVKRYIKDIRLFTNTIKQAVDIMQQAGVEARYEMEEKENCLEIIINIPCH